MDAVGDTGVGGIAARRSDGGFVEVEAIDVHVRVAAGEGDAGVALAHPDVGDLGAGSR